MAKVVKAGLLGGLALALAALQIPISTYAAGGGPPERRPAPDQGPAFAALRYSTQSNGLAAVGKRSAPAATSAGADRLTSKAGKVLSLAPCEDDDSFLCGTLPVPLNRADPSDPRTIGIHVQIAPHTGSDPEPAGVVFSTSGGPGNSITGEQGEMYAFRDYILEGFNETYDMVFIDQRGVGLSEALDCPAWQHLAPTYARAAQCARQLGELRNYFSTAAVADDIDDVRRALGYHKVIFLGGSYVGNDATSFAVRHRTHVEKVVLASPAPAVGFPEFDDNSARHTTEVVETLCRRSTECRRAIDDPRDEMAWLLKRVRSHPVTGTGYDFAGAPRHVRVTESRLIWAMLLAGPPFLPPSEILQASVALRERGDRTPLLRLAAETLRGPGDWDSGDPRVYSNAHSLARLCVDSELPWDADAPRATRWHQWRAAKAAQPDHYGMLSKNAWLTPLPLGFYPMFCIASRFKTQLPYPRNARVDGVPALVLGGDYDSLDYADSKLVNKVFTDSTFVGVDVAGHNPYFWRPCAAQMVRDFITDGATDDLCATDPIPRWWAPGAFPATFAAAPMAEQQPGDESTHRQRRAATVAVWAVLDAYNRISMSPTDQARGLRGGTIQRTDTPPGETGDYFTFSDFRFTPDLKVDGIGTIVDGATAGADVRISGGGVHGRLTFSGVMFSPDSDFQRVVGQLNGRAVKLLVPST